MGLIQEQGRAHEVVLSYEIAIKNRGGRFTVSSKIIPCKIERWVVRDRQTG